MRKINLTLLFAILLSLAGDVAARDSQNLYAEYGSDHYKVYLVGKKMPKDASECVRKAALMMEKMFRVYSSLEEMPLPPGGEMSIWLHLDRREYDRQAALFEFPPKLTAGFCNIDGEVHVYYQKTKQIPDPNTILMHEGFHQYCQRALFFPTPPEVFEIVPGYTRVKLPTVPLWLAEGMAMNMETSRLSADHDGYVVQIDDAKAVNSSRLKQLAGLLQSNRAPSVREILSKIMGDQITTDDYAMMWGIVFDLRVATGNAIFIREQTQLERAGPAAIREATMAATDPNLLVPSLRWPVPLTGRLLRACRIVWGMDLRALVEMSAKGAKEPRDFDRQWNRRITQTALSEFEKLLRDQGQTLEQWETEWRLRMLTLYGEVEGFPPSKGTKGVNSEKKVAKKNPREVREGAWQQR